MKHTPQLSLFTTAAHDPTLEIPYGYCHCGCGKKTKLATQNDAFRHLKKGDPQRFIKGHDKSAPLEIRFWSKVQKSDGCWEWTGTRKETGYGSIRVDGSMIRAHRVSWMLTYGPVPDELCVLHKCDNPSCVRPDHLFLGDQGVNARDRVAKGRHHNFYGEENNLSKLTAAQVLEIRALRQSGLSTRAICEKYGLQKSHVNDLVARRTWKHI